LQRADLLPYVSRVIDVIVQLERRHGVRRISQIKWNRTSAASSLNDQPPHEGIGHLPSTC
jgi:hypothetical protein